MATKSEYISRRFTMAALSAWAYLLSSRGLFAESAKTLVGKSDRRRYARDQRDANTSFTSLKQIDAGLFSAESFAILGDQGSPLRFDRWRGASRP